MNQLALLYCIPPTHCTIAYPLTVPLFTYRILPPTHCPIAYPLTVPLLTYCILPPTHCTIAYPLTVPLFTYCILLCTIVYLLDPPAHSQYYCLPTGSSPPTHSTTVYLMYPPAHSQHHCLWAGDSEAPIPTPPSGVPNIVCGERGVSISRPCGKQTPQISHQWLLEVSSSQPTDIQTSC